ncbi:N-succinylarginine dihydrolase [Legionella jordanis]|uniref:N-succinylarginine dihydrolase n=1 Tax=Legionella jordanis TaxID=456 RepID=A0A0W0VA88_9GAMM|nr:N-succinylarginine dihydrolase [Legionella jordanis]KTD17016.1 succinylarginine dihydrolase [Legionella jordanis]RMX03156.1 N-succinylarginine dihydrolase [Legionella jordanis]VEH12788.1 succinylarginine dihydrolase [Legionella jordanis]
MPAFELNLDGLVGPTHNYAGLSPGNVASIMNALSLSDPKSAALQGLAKMRLLHNLGLKQGVLPPHQRPNLHLLHQMGFHGSPSQQIEKALRTAPELLSACYSASSMWAANAATVSASVDSADGKLHFTAANLISNLHRHQEADFSHDLLKQIFADPMHFEHHPVLPKTAITSDEGAANHNRICRSHGTPGITLLVYGKRGFRDQLKGPNNYPARQTLEASQAIARAHQLIPEQVIFARQNPKAIDEGVFHNDVIAVANETVLLIHEEAWCEQKHILAELKAKLEFPLNLLEIRSQELSVAEAVNTYLFNSQLVSLPNSRGMVLIAPAECEQNPRTKFIIESLIADQSNPINQVYYLELKQSMQNGGGPACLRLRVPIQELELTRMHQGILIDDALLNQLEHWINRHYRSELQLKDLSDPLFIDECLTALDELSTLLNLGSIYPFQRE